MGEAFIVRKGGVGGGVTFGTFDELEFVSNTIGYDTNLRSVVVDNDFIYAGGIGNATTGRDVKKYHKNNLVFINNTNNYGGDIFAIVIDNDFIYVGGTINQTVQKFNKGNLAFVGNTNNFNGGIQSVAIDNDFIYVSGGFFANPSKYHKGNLAFVGNTNSYVTGFSSDEHVILVDDNFIYVGGTGNATANRNVKKWHKGNLVFVANSNNYGGTIRAMVIDNDFVYVGGQTDTKLKKFHKGNLAFDSQTTDVFYPNSGGAPIFTLSLRNDFIYGSGGFGVFTTIKKLHKGNLVTIGETKPYLDSVFQVSVDNEFIYAGGNLERTVQKFANENNTTSASFPVIEDNSRKYYLRGEGL